MQPVVFVSIVPFCGKNVIGLGMAQKLRAEGKRVGYFKPIGPLPVRENGGTADDDALFFKRTLQLPLPSEVLCPVVLDDEMITDVLRGRVKDMKEPILRAYAQASEGCDVVFVFSMGGLSCGRSIGFSTADLIREIGARTIVVDRFRWPLETLDGILEIQAEIGDHLAGVVFNHVAQGRISQVEQAVKPFLADHGVDVFGIVPEDPILNAVPIRQIVDALHGRVLCCGDKLDQLVERFSIGAMNVDAALRFFLRQRNKAVITGGDRADIHLAALETSTRCLILTGGLYPNERILARAEELGVPVIVVDVDTSTVADVCDDLQGHRSLLSAQKIDRVASLVATRLDWALVHRKIGI